MALVYSAWGDLKNKKKTEGNCILEKETFRSYCTKLTKMMNAVPDWYNRSTSLIEDYLQESTAYGHGLWLEQLIVPAYNLVNEYMLQHKIIDQRDLNRIAELLKKRVNISEYELFVYNFVVCVTAVSFFGYSIDNVDCDSFCENNKNIFNEPSENGLERFNKLINLTEKIPLICECIFILIGIVVCILTIIGICTKNDVDFNVSIMFLVIGGIGGLMVGVAQYVNKFVRAAMRKKHAGEILKLADMLLKDDGSEVSVPKR